MSKTKKSLKELLSLKKEYTQQGYTSGRAQIPANFTQSVLPVEDYMCHLSKKKGHSAYYNAILLQVKKKPIEYYYKICYQASRKTISFHID